MTKTTPRDWLVDTDVLWDPPLLRRLAVLVSSGTIRLHFSALVIAERERQLVQQEHERRANGLPVVSGDRLRLFRQGLQQFLHDAPGSLVVSFDDQQAQVVSQLWNDWLSSEPVNKWSGPPESVKRPDNQAERTWTVHKFDWLIAAVVCYTHWTLLTKDQRGIPFRQPRVNRLLVDEFWAQDQQP